MLVEKGACSETYQEANNIVNNYNNWFMFEFIEVYAFVQILDELQLREEHSFL